MRVRPNTMLVVLAAVVACCGLCQGGTIKQLLQMSDAIVVAKPTSITASGPDATAIELSVVSWLAGGSGGPVTILWKTPGVTAQTASPPSLGPGVWFLKRSDGGGYTVVPAHPTPRPSFQDLYFEAAPVDKRPAALAYASDVALSDKIALELLAASASGGGGYRPGDVVGMIAGVESARVRDACAYLAQLSDSRSKAIGLAGLIGLNDPAGPIGLERDLSAITQTDLGNIVAGSLFGSWRNPDRAAVSSLGRLVTKPSVPYPFLLLGAKTLSYIHSAETLPWIRREEQDFRAGWV